MPELSYTKAEATGLLRAAWNSAGLESIRKQPVNVCLYSLVFPKQNQIITLTSVWQKAIRARSTESRSRVVVSFKVVRNNSCVMETFAIYKDIT